MADLWKFTPKYYFFQNCKQLNSWSNDGNYSLLLKMSDIQSLKVKACELPLCFGSMFLDVAVKQIYFQVIQPISAFCGGETVFQHSCSLFT